VRKRSAALTITLVLLSACASTAVDPPASVSSGSAGPSVTLTEPPAASPTADMTAPLPIELGPLEDAQVVVDGLAVRSGPGSSYPFVRGHIYDYVTNTYELVEDEVRLDAGYYTFVNHGPLVIVGIPWYYIGSRTQPGEAAEYTTSWDADGDGFRSDGGWVAGASGVGPFLVAAVVPGPEPQVGGGPEPYAVLHAIGDARSATFHVQGLGAFIVEWYAADPEGEACDMKVTLQPNGLEIDSARVQEWGHHDQIWPEDMEGVEGDYWLEVDSDCSWSVTVRPIVG